MVRCDLEGASGIVSYQQAEPDKEEYAYGRQMFMHDLLSLLEGLKAGGADEIVIYDEHCAGRNIDISRLPVYAKAICGKPPYRADWAGGLDKTFAGLILLGFHAKAGTAGGLLPHTYEWDIKNILLNGVSIGEIGMEAAIAGDYNVPTIMITGDSAGVREAQALLPGIASVAVKDGVTETGGICRPLELAGRMIKETAIKAVRAKVRPKPYRIEDDFTLKIVLRPGLFLNAMKKLHRNELCGGRSLILSAGTITAAWSDYWEKKLACLRYLKAGK